MLEHKIAKGAGEFLKSELQTGAINGVQAFMNTYPVVTGIVGTVFAGGLILLIVLVGVAAFKKKTV
jgi:hypothetical protein